ncbi:GreA/GreB family elongation factor [Alienimonas chondri]|uniref:Transcription elongation factor GreA n=1 Tax=Alienimonas chondri TaxID=2681879 RepID=A0ABX1VCK3_9PLAN|nr:transcription elongation factor GreA [Alienimonas chondri]NNJ25043.1 Transcription elongation factor GreA [Alienimonas chondri]
MDRQPITREGYDKLKAEVHEIETVLLPRCREAIKTAREEGDLSENTEYHSQRETQAMLNAKAAQIKTKLANSQITDVSDLPTDKVAFGCIVTVKDGDGEESRYELVGPGEDDYMAEPMKILTASPVGEALIGKKVGQKTKVEKPAGTVTLTVVKVEAPA